MAAGTPMQQEQGIEDSTERLKEYWLEVGQNNVNEEIIKLYSRQKW